MLSERTMAWVQLVRLDKPIGIYLLLWPTYWALWVAAQGIPSVSNLIIFTLGVILMRSAGCIINDFADRKIDIHVKRTQTRPLASGKISSKSALLAFVCLCLLAFCLVCFSNLLTIKLSVVAVILASFYPFSKRFTHWPQFFLGLAFSWAIPMAFAAQLNELPSVLWWLFSANIIWILIYDTLYAMVDRDDDIKIGVKSTAVLFAQHDQKIIALLQIIVLVLLIGGGIAIKAGAVFYLFIVIASLVFIYQQRLILKRTREAYFQAFKCSHWFGFLIWMGLVFQYLS